MKILFNCLTLKKGGAERVINILSNSFVKDNDIMIVSNMYGNAEYTFDEKIKIKCLANRDSSGLIKKLKRISPFVLNKLKRIIVDYEPDVIISFLPEPNFRLLFLKKTCKKIKNIPTIISVRNDPNTEYKKSLYKFIMKKLYPLADQMVLQTNDAKEYFHDVINYDGVVISNPVDKSFLVERYEGIRDKRIVAVGRLYEQKNYKNMIDAFKIVYEKHNDYILEIYGDGKLKEELQKYIDDSGLHDKILLMGKVDNIKDRIYKASAFVMSSDYEGMPNALLEAACLGVPCVSTDCPCGGPREILNDGKNGVLVPVNDSKKLADGICELIDNVDVAEKFSINSNESSINYKDETIMEEWQNVINYIVSKVNR